MCSPRPSRPAINRGRAIARVRASALCRGDGLRYPAMVDEDEPLALPLRQSGKRIALASSAKGDELSIYEQIAEIGDLVDARATADDAQRSKPYPDIFQAALAQLASAPSDTLAVGDTPYDAEAAVKAGIVTLGVLSGGFPEADLRRAGCREIHRDVADLLSHYDASLIAWPK